MQSHLAEQDIAYTGAELRSGWLRETFGLAGDAVAAFIGPCDVAPEHMVDLEDLAAGAAIFSRRMLHFIVEHTGADLPRAVLRQRLLVVITAECLAAGRSLAELRRDGDDLYWHGRKLSISIATTSPGSALIHLGLNIIAEGAPVPAAALGELGAEPQALARQVMAAYIAEMESADAAERKVRRVR